ncbi:hypothetical protein AB0K21_21825 [Streptosporangium sp. NPDC049248]|uniref:hypothetical protein n=1 Tax=Streptosporangium sp. NPDC049248 TaxID=3155651 RepID=UPI003412DDB3
MKGHPRTQPIVAARHFGACTCGADRYSSKKVAKLAVRQLYPGRNLRVYRCKGYWHYRPQMLGVSASLVIVDEAVNWNPMGRKGA